MPDASKTISFLGTESYHTVLVIAREFYLSDGAIEVLGDVGTGTGYISKNAVGSRFDTDDLRIALIKVARIVGYNDLTKVHGLRHTYNSLMQMAGVDIATMGKILGHQDIETTMIYTHQTTEHLKKSVEMVRI